MINRIYRYVYRILREFPSLQASLGTRGAIGFFFVSPVREMLRPLFGSPYAISLREGRKAWIRPGTSDRMVFDQIFVFQEYAPLLHRATPQYVVDLGANCGFSSLWFLSNFPSSRVLYVEPFSANFRAASHNLAAESKRARGINAAVWDKETILYLDFPVESGPVQWGVRATEVKTDSETVRALPIEKIFEWLPDDARILLKVDIEGAETNLFRSTSDWLSKVDVVSIELHGDEARQQIEKVFTAEEWTHEKSGELDIFFRKDCSGS